MDVVAVLAPVVAHQGGWDEILLISIPILLIGGALRVAKRRVEATTADTDADDVAGDATPAEPTD